MRRREFLGFVGSATVGWPFVARAQRSSIRVVGLLSGAPREVIQPLLRDLADGMAEAGYVEGRNLAIEYRWAEGQYDRLPALAEELVRQQVQVIITTGGGTSALAAHKATSTIPIVSLIGSDPVKLGLAASLSRPGGNLTGVAQLFSAADGKRLEILHELVPGAQTIGYLANPTGAAFDEQRSNAEQVSTTLGVKLRPFQARSETEINSAFAAISSEGISAVMVGADPFFFSRVNQFVSLAAAHSVPAIYFLREYVRAGGLISYGTRLADAYRQVGVYTGRILAGANPADLPIVQQSEKIELSINLKTARALGISVPTPLLLRADEIIE